jgi:tartrate dehydratase alpha subunit/fumarate hydratase class I-like protein
MQRKIITAMKIVVSKQQILQKLHIAVQQNLNNLYVRIENAHKEIKNRKNVNKNIQKKFIVKKFYLATFHVLR